MKKLVIGMLAHVDAGKTTLSESILYTSGAIRKLGRVDNKDAFLDNNDYERQRGITIFSKQARFQLGEKEITDRDLNVFFADKAMQSDVVAGWTDTAVRKLKQCFTRMMFEAGLLESSAKPRTIKPIHIDYRTEELLTAKGLGEYLKAVKGV